MKAYQVKLVNGKVFTMLSSEPISEVENSVKIRFGGGKHSITKIRGQENEQQKTNSEANQRAKQNEASNAGKSKD